MTYTDDKRLNDIRRMCVQAARIVERGRAAMEADEVLWLGAERVVEIAGEAATQIDDATRAKFPDVDWKALIAVRVVLAHAYHRVDPDLLWEILDDDLPRVSEALGPLAEHDA